MEEEFYFDEKLADGTIRKISWKPPQNPIGNFPPPPKAKKEPTCLEEEVWELVQEAYRQQGKGVPASEAKILLDEIKKAKAAKEKEAKELMEAAKNAPLNPVIGKPEYGSPEFWKAHWEKKKASGWVSKSKTKESEGTEKKEVKPKKSKSPKQE